MASSRQSKAPVSQSGSKLLAKWLNALPPVPNPETPAMEPLIELAVQYRSRMIALLKDPQVAASVDQSVRTAAQSCSTAIAVERIAQLLVDACWLSHAPHASKHLFENASNQAGSRTDNLRELMAAAKTAKDLGTRLKSLTAESLTVSHLTSRLAAGNATLFVHQRKGWNIAVHKTESPHVSELLETLACELTEEAAMLSLIIETTRQPGSSRQGINMLIDHLLQRSVNLGALNLKGEPVPDFDFVHSVVTSLHPTLSLDISTARKRWAARQGKLKLKNP